MDVPASFIPPLVGNMIATFTDTHRFWVRRLAKKITTIKHGRILTRSTAKPARVWTEGTIYVHFRGRVVEIEEPKDVLLVEAAQLGTAPGVAERWIISHHFTTFMELDAKLTRERNAKIRRR